VSDEQGERENEVLGDEEEVAREEAAAAEDAGSIGGHRDEDADEAERPVAEGGGGEAEGFELAEEDLVDAAEQGHGHNPMTQAGEPEQADPDAEYGESDHVDSSEREDAA
jgi:hypothetical protein